VWVLYRLGIVHVVDSVRAMIKPHLTES
jgi:hypothetical protein